MWLLAALLLPVGRGGASPLRTAIPLQPPALSAEARCALSLLPAYLGGEQGFGRLQVVASAGWVNDAFLGRLSSIGVPVTVQDAAPKQLAFAPGGPLPASHTALVLVAVDNVNLLPERLLSATDVRYLVWLSTDTHSPARFAEVRAKAMQSCQIEMRLAVSAGGTTRLYSLRGGCHIPETLAAVGLTYSVLPDVAELDRWSAGAGWRGGRPSPYRACVSWEPAPGGAKALEVLIETSATSEEEMRLARVVVSAVRRYRTLSERRFSIVLRPGLHEIWQQLWECGLDLLIFPYVDFARKYVGFPWQMEGLVAVVPAGLRLRGQLGLSSLTKPLTVTLWCASAAAAAAVGLGLWLHAGEDSCLRAALQAVSPLLAQPVAVRAGRQRRVLAPWLLAAVVLSAAYQCDLRSTLVAPVVTSQVRIRNMHKITSERELAESNLTIIFNKLLQVVSNRRWPDDGRGALIEDMDEAEGMRRVAERRDAALLTDTTRLPLLLRGFERRVSAFRIAGTERIKAFMITTRGSPLEAPLRSLIPRLRAAGLLERRVEPLAPGGGAGKPRPAGLGWENVAPAFTVLAQGLAAAALLFLAELCGGGASGLRSWARPGKPRRARGGQRTQ